MNTHRESHTPSRASAHLVGLVALMLASSLQAHQAPADETINSVKSQGRFTPNDGSQEFPPQPRELQNVRYYKPIPESQYVANEAARAVLSGAAASPGAISARQNIVMSVERRGPVREALGARYALISASDIQNKWTPGQNNWNVTFFSHSNNQTIEVQMRNGAMTDVITTPANVNQPALGESERDEAISIALAYWQGHGANDVGDLIGYAIQAFPVEGGLYPVRMAYVSFHREPSMAPDYASWVDLTNQRVVEQEIEQ